MVKPNLSVRSYLFLLTLCAVLPVLIYAAYVSTLLIDQDRESIRRGAMDRTRALLTAVDSELQGSIAALEGLATSRALDTGDLRAFHAESVRVLASQSDWLTIALSTPEGQQVVNAKVPFGEAVPPVVEPASARKVVQTGRPAIGSVVVGKILKTPVVPVRVPVIREGKVAYVLSAAVRPETLETLIVQQKLPQGWIIGLVDADYRFVARVPPRPPGSESSPAFRAAASAATEGWYRGQTVEGKDAYTAFFRSEFSNWALGFAIPGEFLEAGARRTTWLLSLGALATIMLAFFIAALVGRRISTPIVLLADSARAIGQGQIVDTAHVEHIREARLLADALKDAGKAVQEQQVLVEREKAALLAADRSKDQFIAMLSHELRNPLAALGTAAQVLKMADPAQEAAANARGVIERQTAHMARLVEDLLDINRIVMGKAPLQRAPMDLGALASEVVRSWREAGRLGNHRVDLSAASVPLNADHSRLEQVLANLLDNALKFSPPGKTIRVEVFREAQDAVLRVSDDGEGMEAAAIERMFELFVQGTQGLERRTGGLGVGLALVKRLVEMHGGSVAAASGGPGKGSTFTVRLPVAA